MERLDAVVIGAGVIGLAVARALALRGREVMLVEAESAIGTGTSSRNSGVIHAGIYYPPGSAKAAYCVRGRALLYAYLAQRQIPHRRCGKLIVATCDPERAMLAQIAQRARANGVADLRTVTAREACAMEPELSCVEALHSPATGILDVPAFLQSLLADLEAHGGILARGNHILGGEAVEEGVALQLSDATVRAATVVNAAGLGAQALAAAIKGIRTASIPPRYLAKGNYFAVSGAAPFSRLVYPVPTAGGLGAHFTMNLGGESLFGPDVEWLDNAMPHTHHYDVDAARGAAMAAAVSRYWPGVAQRPLMPAYAGIRPKIVPPGAAEGDFAIHGEAQHGVPGLVNLYGIESPGITAALAIAEGVADLCAG